MPPKTTLKILLVLSMISAVVSGVLCFFPSLYGHLPALVAWMGFDEHMVGAMSRLAEIEMAMPREYTLILGCLWLLSFTGCLLMWKYRPSGFHCYTLSQLLLILVPLLFIGKGAVGLGNVMFTVLFVLCYWRLMKTFEETPMTSESSESSEPSD